MHPDMLMTTEEQAHYWSLFFDSLTFIIPPEDDVAIKEVRIKGREEVNT